MSKLFKLFTSLIKLAIPGLNLGSVFISFLLKFLFALIVVGTAAGVVGYVKHKYTDYTTAQEQLAKAKQNTNTVLEANKDLVRDVETAVKTGTITAEVVTTNSDAKLDISEKTNKTLSELKQKRDKVKVKKDKPKTEPAVVDPPPDKTDTVELSQPELNINAAWASYCELGGDTTQCTNNT